jgi:hypothetical protein
LANDFPKVGRRYDVELSEDRVKVFPRNLRQH